MLVIDWFSPPNHRNFSKAFFTALSEIHFSEYIVFDERLLLQEVKSSFLEAPASRFRRALFVIILVFKARKKKILLLTYDPLYLPLILIFKSDLIVYEHNTTPEEKDYLKSIWQILFFKRVLRLAQFLGQYRRLLDLRQKVVYLGSPLYILNSVYSNEHEKDLFIIPSARSVLNYLEKYNHIFKGEKILAKNNGVANFSPKEVDLMFKDRLELFYDSLPIKGILVSIDSYIRGTGWFNEAISNQIPLLVMNNESKVIFEETFPKFPFIYLEDIGNKTELFERLSKLRDYKDNRAYILRHNKTIQLRFVKHLGVKGTEDAI
tara:strand:+ start:886 stop:1845 length:960 start_codon:yes stop_codon:yes gene_type:complete